MTDDKAVDDDKPADKILREFLVALADVDLVAAHTHYEKVRKAIEQGERVSIRRKDREAVSRWGTQNA